jgi:hypothetical protein
VFPILFVSHHEAENEPKWLWIIKPNEKPNEAHEIHPIYHLTLWGGG